MIQVLGKYKFTPQEQKVVLLAVAGRDDSFVAQQLGISRETVRVYWKRIREKTGLSKRTAIISKLLMEASEATQQEVADDRELLLAELVRRTRIEEQLRAILDGAVDNAIIFMTPEREITEWNRGAEKIVGYSREEALGQLGDIIFLEEDRRRGMPAREAEGAARKGSTSDVRWHCRKDGGRFWGVGSMNAVLFPDGTLRGFVKVFADETRLRELEENRGR